MIKGLKFMSKNKNKEELENKKAPKREKTPEQLREEEAVQEAKNADVESQLHPDATPPALS